MDNDKRSPCLVIKYDKYQQMKEDINKLIDDECGSCFNIDKLFSVLDKYIDPDSINKKCCGNCYWYNGNISEQYAQFCDEREIHTKANDYCSKFRNRHFL